MRGYHAHALRCNAELASRLAKLIPRLASPHDGEVVATVHAVRRTLQTAGLDLHDLARALTTSTPIDDVPQDDWLAVARWRRDHGQTLNDRERQFIIDMIAWCRWGEPTARQRAWLAAIADRIEKSAA
jgi:hypothetical protein